MSADEQPYVNVARQGAATLQVMAETLTAMLVVTMATESLTFTPEELAAVRSKMLGFDVDSETGDVTITIVDAISEDERVPGGSYMHAMSGIVVWVLGVTPEDRVAMLHQKDEPGEHRGPDERIDSFLKAYVPYGNIPMLGGES